MHYASPIVRPPYEARSVFLQVTTGCSHDFCKFCTYYKDVPFTISPINEIIEDLEELKSTGYSFKRIWLQGADPFILSFDQLYKIAQLIHEYLPFVESIGGYSRVDNLRNKTVKELKILKEMGYKSIVFGIESADDKILEYMNKGYKSDEIIKQLSKMDEAELSYAIIFLNGLGGHNYGENHAKKTAQLLNQLNPERIMIAGLTLFPDTPLTEDVHEGKFIEADEKEKIEELQVFLKELQIKTFIDATNASIITPIFGKIPENKEAMIEHLQKTLDKYEEKTLRNKRNKLKVI